MSAKRLDYQRAAMCKDVELLQFLLTVHEQDTVRRLQSAWPEYFTREPADNTLPEHMLQRRYASCRQHQSWSEILAWFGHEPIIFEYAPQGVETVSKFLPTPKEYKLVNDPNYVGIASSSRHCFQALWQDPETGELKMREYLVLSEEPVSETDGYLVYAVPVEIFVKQADN